jgi:hypothetical protein
MLNYFVSSFTSSCIPHNCIRHGGVKLCSDHGRSGIVSDSEGVSEGCNLSVCFPGALLLP